MKKLVLLAMTLMGVAQANAQDVPYIYTEVADNTYAIMMTNDEIAATYDTEWCDAAWNIGAVFPTGTVLFENDELTITAGTDTPVYTENNKWSQMNQEFGYNGYVNLGSGLETNNWTGDEQIFPDDLQSWAASNHGILVVTPKVDGTLKFGVYAGDNSREIGIYRLDENYENYGWVAFNNFRNDGENGTVANAPAYVEGAVTAGEGLSYALMGGSNKNLTMHQISFVPSTGTGITGVDAVAEKTVKAYYTLDGVQVNEPVKGVYIVKYSDGTTAKLAK